MSTPSTNHTPKWGEQKAKLKAKFPILTDADLHYDQGKEEEMMSKIQKKIGKSKDELKEILAKF
jgi:uncharacterized protein YjbJ (UPF0337 family)